MPGQSAAGSVPSYVPATAARSTLSAAVVSVTLVESVFVSFYAVFLPLQDTINAAAKSAAYIRFLFISFLLTIICGAKLRIYNQILSVGVFKSSKKILGNGKFPKSRLLQKIEQGERNILAIPLLTYINKA